MDQSNSLKNLIEFNDRPRPRSTQGKDKSGGNCQKWNTSNKSNKDEGLKIFTPKQNL